MIYIYKVFSIEFIIQLLLNIVIYNFFQCLECFFINMDFKNIFLYILYICEVVEEIEGDGDVGGVSRLQGKFNVI